MKNPIQITIPTPCHENWANMTPSDKGRFCAACQKSVRDFTRSSDREIAKVLKNEGKLCGRFLPSQIDRDLYIPKEKSKFWAAASAAAITLLTVGVNEVSAQTPVTTEQHETKENNTDRNNLPEGFKIITGIVVDSQGMPIPGVNIEVIGTGISAQTDFDGVYSIAAKEGNTIEFSFVGMDIKTIKVSEKNKYKTEMVEMEDAIIGLIVVGYGKLRISVASQYMFDY